MTRERARFSRIVLLAGVALVLAACGGDGSSGGGPSMEQTAWTLTQLDGEGVEGPAPLTLVFGSADEATPAEAFGSTGCNGFNGPYQTEGDSITIGPLITTLAACVNPVAQAQEELYLITLQTAETFSVSGDTFMLADSSGETTAEFGRFEPDLTLTSWEAVSINNGAGGVQSIVSGSTVTIEFGEVGLLAGSGGCNTYSSAYRVGEEYDVGEGGSILVAGIASRRQSCDPAIDEQEQNYYTALENSRTWIMRGLNLELRDAEGAVQVLYVRSPGG